MSRPRLDLATARLPLPLQPQTLEVDAPLAARWLGALDHQCPASQRLVDRGIIPPQALTANTVFLAFRNYDLAGGIYAREQVTYHRPVHLGETLLVEGEIATTYVRRGRRYRIMESRTFDSNDELVVSSRSTGLQQLERGEENDVGETLETPPPAPDPHAAPRQPSLRRLQALSEDEQLLGPQRRVSLEMMKAEAGPESFNPIHTDEEAARRAGLEAPIVGGPHVLAFVYELLMDQWGEELLLHGAHVDVRWIRPVLAGALVRPRAVVREAAGSPSGTVAIGLTVDCQDQRALAGTAKIPT